MIYFKKLRTDKNVEKNYVEAGADFGSAVSDLCLGERVGFESMLNKWAKWEQEYSRRGFRTIAVEDFTNLGGWGHDISDLLGQKRGDNEEPIYPAENYRTRYLGKVKPAIDLTALIPGEHLSGTMKLPTTGNE